MTVRREQGNVPVSSDTGSRPRSFAKLVAIAVCAALAFAGFAALGTWQLQRLKWKLALIERVEQRVHAAPVPAPGPERWQQVSAQSDEYRHVRVTGTFLPEFTTKVQATTVLGSGFWLLTPLRTADGNLVLINRGFVSAESADQVRDQPRTEAPRAGERGTAVKNGTTTVTGLLRMSEPGGGFLRKNDAVANRWFSRDVKAIAAARGLAGVAPYFIDADAKQEAGDVADDASTRPVGGLTVVSFQNNHLVYALTWYALALMAAGAGVWVVRDERRAMRRAAAASDRINKESHEARRNGIPRERE